MKVQNTIIGAIALTLATLAVIQAVWAETETPTKAQERVDVLTARVATLDSQDAAMAKQYKDLLELRAKLREQHKTIVQALEKVDKALTVFVVTTEKNGKEREMVREEAHWLKERLKEVKQGAASAVALDATEWVQMLSDGRIKLPTSEEVK
jgi:septal ring factor EnvC (AmiA/AmiB activator)